MQRLWKMLAVLAVMFVLPSTAAYAQATRTWVSGVGDDANPCSRTAPCKTFAGSISKTAAGGEINCLDPGGFGGVTITKSITIRCEGVIGGVLVSGTNGIIVNAATTDRVVLEGLDIEGLSSGLNGIRVIQARDVVVMNSTIRNFRDAANGNGILINGTAGQARVTVKNVSFIGNLVGINVAHTGSSGSAKVSDSLFTVNTNAAIRVNGAANSAAIDGNAFYATAKAVELLAGGTATSFGNNAINTATDPLTLTPLQ